ncbi:Senescence-specific cysteine protease SAG39-like protein, partial [Drosera capensis]
MAARGPTLLRPVTFVTGNPKKLEEVKAILGNSIPFQSLKLVLPELQGGPEEISKEKARLAAVKAPNVTALLWYDALDDAPIYLVVVNFLHWRVFLTSLFFWLVFFVALLYSGTQNYRSKWFLQKIGHEGLNNLLVAYKDKSAYALCVFSLALGPHVEPITFLGKTRVRTLFQLGDVIIKGFMAGAKQFSGFMLLAFFLGLGLLTSASRPLSNDSSMVKKHEDWMVQYGRTYKDNAEKAMRFEIFKKTVEFIEAHNRLDKGYTLSVNGFADLTDEEFRKIYTGYKRHESSNPSLKSTSFRYKNFTDVPSSVNWVAAGAVTPIKNQGTCGSCWAFASVATIESLCEITTGNLISLSEQEILDCDVNGEDHGCNGGFADGAYQFVINNGGLTTEDNYPYVGYQE